MGQIPEFILLLLSQFGGGPGPVENNLVRFGLPAILWAILLYVAWGRRRSQNLPRERLLVWGFGLALVRELYMFGQMSYRLLSDNAEATCEVIQPLEHGLAMAAMIVVSAAFLLYILEDEKLAKRYLFVGLAVTILAFVLTSWLWPRQLAALPQVKFHQTWAAWLFHVPLSIFLVIAIFLLMRKRGWLSYVVAAALSLYLISELLLLVNYATGRAYNAIICPIGNTLHILAIPLLGYVYFREQSLEKKQADEALLAYRDHLEELVGERTGELTAVNARLKQEVSERTQAEEALERVTRRYELILDSTGEGICGINSQGEIIFVNPAAAGMLGYSTTELIHRPGYSIWHPPLAAGGAHPPEACPIYQGHSLGIQRRGDDETFWRKDRTGFPIRYFTNPVWEKDELSGSVLVFQDITRRKQNEAEIAQRTGSLATQNALAATLGQSLVLEENLSNALQMLQAEVKMEIGLIFLLSAETGNLVPYLNDGPLSMDEITAFSAPTCKSQQIAIQALAEKHAITANVIQAPAAGGLFCSCHPDISSLISLPLLSKGQAIGLLTLASRDTVVIQPHQLEMLTAIGLQIGMAIENSRLYQQAENWAEELSRLHEASSYLTAAINREQVNTEVARQSAWLLRSEKACIIQQDDRSGQFEMAAGYGIGQAEWQRLSDSLATWSFWVEAFVHPKTIAIPNEVDENHLPEGLRNELDLAALLLTPIWSGERPSEFVVVIETGLPRRWNRREIELIESLANRAAVILMNANLHRQLELAAALEERQRIAATMHDGLAQTLSLLGMRVDRMQEFVEADSNAATEQAIREIRDAVTRAANEVRQSIASLQEAPRPRNAFNDLLVEMLDNLEIEHGVMLQYNPHAAPPIYLERDQSDQVLPIIQEALLNAIRHAQARTISLRLEKEQEMVRVSIVDDGIGFDLAAHGQASDHFGLSIMQARAARIGGQLHIVTTPGDGTKISLVWKLKRSDTSSPAQPTRLSTTRHAADGRKEGEG